MPAKLDRCVADVKGDKGVDNAYAVCNASVGEAFMVNNEYPSMKQEGGVGSGIKGHTTAKDQPQGKQGGSGMPPYQVSNPANSIYPDELTFIPDASRGDYIDPDDADMTPEEWKERSKFWIDHAASGLALDYNYSAQDLGKEFGLPHEWNQKVMDHLRSSLSMDTGNTQPPVPP